MTRLVALVVEGQTEEAFVTRVLQPHIGFDAATLMPIVVHTSRAANGTAFRGGGSWKHYERQIRGLLAQPHWSCVTTLIDFYGYPSDAPACSCTGSHTQPDCVAGRERGIRQSLPYDARFEPFVALHEFETLVIAAAAQSAEVLCEATLPARFQQLINSFDGNAELINDGPLTAPSKRVLTMIPDYRKVRDGVSILEGELAGALLLTPRFASWVDRIAGRT